MPLPAVVKAHDSHQQAPVLSDGLITPAVLAELEIKCQQFFLTTQMTAVDRTPAVLYGLEHQEVKAWVLTNRAELRDYPFEKLMSELRRLFLDPSWKRRIIREDIRVEQSPSTTFAAFASRVLTANQLLVGTPDFMEKTQLRTHLRWHMAGYLAKALDCLGELERSALDNLERFEDWLTQVKKIDSRARESLDSESRKRVFSQSPDPPSKRCRITESSTSEPPHFACPPSAPSACTTQPHLGTATFPPPAASSSLPSNSSSSRPLRLKPLSEEERQLLAACRGCTRCRQVNVNHSHANCPNGFPDPATYETLTAEMALKAMASTPATTAAAGSASNAYSRCTPSAPSDAPARPIRQPRRTARSIRGRPQRVQQSTTQMAERPDYSTRHPPLPSRDFPAFQDPLITAYQHQQASLNAEASLSTPAASISYHRSTGAPSPSPAPQWRLKEETLITPRLGLGSPLVFLPSTTPAPFGRPFGGYETPERSRGTPGSGN